MNNFVSRIAPLVDRVCGQLCGAKIDRWSGEDVLQASKGEYTIDVGWYPSNSRRGRYVAVFIRDCDWDRPLERIETRDPAVVERFFLARIEELNGGKPQ